LLTITSRPGRIGLPLIAVFAGLALVGASPAVGGTINSNLAIEAGQTFELGGGQEGGFTVTGRNNGPVAVEVLAKANDAAAPVSRAIIAPGGKVDAGFAAGEMALLRNTSATRKARLDLRISGDTSSLGMGYTDNR
jgi:hypothetical protein